LSNDVEALDYAAANTNFTHKLLTNLIVDGGRGTVGDYPEFAAHQLSKLHFGALSSERAGPGYVARSDRVTKAQHWKVFNNARVKGRGRSLASQRATSSERWCSSDE
jgi:hypothetical protein